MRAEEPLCCQFRGPGEVVLPPRRAVDAAVKKVSALVDEELASANSGAADAPSATRSNGVKPRSASGGPRHAAVVDVSVFSVATEGLSDPRVRVFALGGRFGGTPRRSPARAGRATTGWRWRRAGGGGAAAGAAGDHARCTGPLRRATPAQILAAYARVVGGRRRAVVLGLETGCPPGRCTPGPTTAPRRRGGRASPGCETSTAASWRARRRAWRGCGGGCRRARVLRVKRGVNRTSGQLGIGRLRARTRTPSPTTASSGWWRTLSTAACAATTARCATTSNGPTTTRWCRARRRRRRGLVMPTQVRNRHSGVAPCFVHAPGTHEINRKAFRKRRRIMEPWDAIVRAMANRRHLRRRARGAEPDTEPRPGEVARL